MFHNNWFGEDNNIDDIDPGKDIFALLFLSFFLINAVILICVSPQNEESIHMNTNAKGTQKVIDSSRIANIMINNGKISITQNNKTYLLPDEMQQLNKEAFFETHKDKNGKNQRLLIFNDPGKSLTAGEMLSAINILNKNGIGVDFRKILKEK